MLLKGVEIAEGENHQRRPGLEEGRVEKSEMGVEERLQEYVGEGGKGMHVLASTQ